LQVIMWFSVSYEYFIVFKKMHIGHLNWANGGRFIPNLIVIFAP